MTLTEEKLIQMSRMSMRQIGEIAKKYANFYCVHPGIFGDYKEHFSIKKGNSEKRRHDPRFVIKKMRRLVTKTSSLYEARMRLVGGDKAYCGDNTLRLIKEQDKLNEEALRNLFLTRPDGKSVCVADLGKQEYQVISEMYTYLKGVKELAIEMKMKFIFFTMTCPPEFHPNPSKGKRSWNGASMKEANDFLTTRWKNAVREFHNLENMPMALRVVEAHKDGTPHWHGVIYYNEHEESKVVNTLEKFFTSDERRLKLKGFERASNVTEEGKASPETYMLKYIMKSFGQGEDITPFDINGELEEIVNSEDRSREAVSAILRANSIRRFSWTGVKRNVSLWYTLRGIENRETDFDISEEESDVISNINGKAMVKELQKIATENKSGEFMKRAEIIKEMIDYRPVVEEKENIYGEKVNVVSGFSYIHMNKKITIKKKAWMESNENENYSLVVIDSFPRNNKETEEEEDIRLANIFFG